MRKKDFTISLWRCVIDSSSLINIQHRAGVRELVRRRKEMLIPKKVAYEVAYHPKVRKMDPLRQFIIKYRQVITQFQIDEEDEYLRIAGQQGIDPGEAAAIAIALKRNIPLVIDEKETKAKGKANNHGVETLSWQDFIKGKHIK